jgi:hypothetical protein
MLRLALIIGTVVVLALQPLDAGAQEKNKDKNKLKLCADSGGKGVRPPNRCAQPKAVKDPTSLQIGGPTFGNGGSPNKTGTPGTVLRPGPNPTGPNVHNKAPIGGASIKTVK